MLHLPNGIPSHDTFGRVVVHIDPDQFETSFIEWVQGISGTFQGGVAIDGETSRRTHNRAAGKKALHLICGRAVENRSVLAQFLFLLLDNPGFCDMIEGITSRAVLFIGSFAAERKMVAEVLREAVRNRNYVPITFDIDKPIDQDIKKILPTLASIVRFVLVDPTEAESNDSALHAT